MNFIANLYAHSYILLSQCYIAFRQIWQQRMNRLSSKIEPIFDEATIFIYDLYSPFIVLIQLKMAKENAKIVHKTANE